MIVSRPFAWLALALTLAMGCGKGAENPMPDGFQTLRTGMPRQELMTALASLAPISSSAWKMEKLVGTMPTLPSTEQMELQLASPTQLVPGDPVVWLEFRPAGGFDYMNLVVGRTKLINMHFVLNNVPESTFGEMLTKAKAKLGTPKKSDSDSASWLSCERGYSYYMWFTRGEFGVQIKEPDASDCKGTPKL
jgi:hypothetical protein